MSDMYAPKSQPQMCLGPSGFSAGQAPSTEALLPPLHSSTALRSMHLGSTDSARLPFPIEIP